MESISVFLDIAISGEKMHFCPRPFLLVSSLEEAHSE